MAEFGFETFEVGVVVFDRKGFFEGGIFVDVFFFVNMLCDMYRVLLRYFSGSSRRDFSLVQTWEMRKRSMRWR